MKIQAFVRRYLGGGKQETPKVRDQEQVVPTSQDQSKGLAEQTSQRQDFPKLTRFRHLVIRYFAGEPRIAELEAIEQALGTRLPAEFVEYLGAANGGSTEYAARVPPPDGEWIGMGRLFSTHPDNKGKYSYGTFLGEIQVARETVKTPQEVLPFADDGGGCVFYLDLTVEGQGRVVVFRSGLPPWTGRPSEDKFIPVAVSFVEFIDSLSIEPGLAGMILEDALATQDEKEIAVVTEILDSGLPGWREILGKDVE